MALGPNAPPNVTSAKEAAEKTAPSIREGDVFSKVSGSNPRRFATFYREVPKKVDWGHKKPCVSVRAWHEKNAKTGRARRSMWLIPHVRRPIDAAAHAVIPPRLIGYWNAPRYPVPWEKRPTWRMRDRGLVPEIACAHAPQLLAVA